MGRLSGEEQEERHAGGKRWRVIEEKKALPFWLDPGMSRRVVG